MLKGVISAEDSQPPLQCTKCLDALPGYSHVIPSQPTAKNELKTKRKTAATIPVVVLVCEVAPARIAIDICSCVSVIFKRIVWHCGMESYSLTSSAEQHELSAPKLFDRKDSDEGGKKVFGTVQGSKKTAEKARKTDAVLKDGGGIVLR